MKSIHQTATLLACFLFSTAQSQLIPFINRHMPKPETKQPAHFQQIMAYPGNGGPGIQLPPSNTNDDDDDKSRPKGDIILSDVLSTKPQIQIFAGFTRDISSVANRLDNALQNTTVLAPSNRAITSLPRKPWEDPRDYGAWGAKAYSGEEGEDRAQANLRRFTEAHVVPFSPWEEGEKVQSAGGSTVWWEKKDGKIVIQPGEVEVEGVVSRVANGEVWVLKDVLNYA